MRSALAPVREPLLGSASSGQPARSASTRAGGPASSPATTTVRGPADRGSGSADAARAPGPVAGTVQGAPSGRPSSSALQPSATSGVSGPSNWTLRCTGPRAVVPRPSAVSTVRATRARQPRTCSASRWPGTAAGTSAKARTASPKSLTWSVVWFAFVPRSEAGRSALSTTSGRPAWAASRTAGCRLATAVPLVVTTTVGRREVRARPRARKAGGPLVDAGVQAQPPVRGGAVQREGQGGRARPGAEHDVPHAVADQLVDQGAGVRGRCVGCGLRDGHERRSCPIAAIRACQCATRSGGAALAASRAGSTSGRPTGRVPSSGSKRPAYDVVGEQLHRGQPAGVRQGRERGGQGQAHRDADAGLQGAGDHHRQADVLGDPQAGPDPAERLHLEHGDVGGLQVAHPVGVLGPADRLVGGDRHVDPAAYGGQVLDARAGLLDVLQAAGGPVQPPGSR